MSKLQNIFSCQECGAQYPKWVGRCQECGQWGSVLQECQQNNVHQFDKSENFEPMTFLSLDQCVNVDRVMTGISEFDNLCGGGIVRGSIILIGGDPGIGKSTLLLQIVGALSKISNTVYVSGEEAAEQISIRATRLGLEKSNVKLGCQTNLESILGSISKDDNFVVIDSIQTLFSSLIESVPGTVSQVRGCTHKLIEFAKKNGITIFLVGHVTKEGAIAGPKVLEHMVDTVLYFEGDRGHSYRILRAVKNRFGPCDEVAIFEMTKDGLKEVSNPSSLFLTQRNGEVAGTVAFAGIEGTRPLFVEIQSLVSKTYFPAPRRTVVGWDINRLFMILAVLESKCNISFANKDVYLSIAGGIKISEPAVDLAVAIALLSSRYSIAIDTEICAFGEIGLSGEVRCVVKPKERIREAQRLGFSKIMAPFQELEKDGAVIGFKTLMDVVEFLKKLSTKKEEI